MLVAGSKQEPGEAASGLSKLLKTSTAGRHYRNAGAKEKRAVVLGAPSDVGRFDHLAHVDLAAAPTRLHKRAARSERG
jgi:hypothetical protein